MSPNSAAQPTADVKTHTTVRPAKPTCRIRNKGTTVQEQSEGGKKRVFRIAIPKTRRTEDGRRRSAAFHDCAPICDDPQNVLCGVVDVRNGGDSPRRFRRREAGVTGCYPAQDGLGAGLTFLRRGSCRGGNHAVLDL